MIVRTRDNCEIIVSEFKASKTKAIFIIVHGASEHFKRYYDFASFLQKNNILCAGYDLLGHGINRDEKAKGIYFASENGEKKLVNDLEDVVLHYYTHYPKIPIFIFGHSMGSLILRSFAINTRLLVDGIILCGSLQPSDNKIKNGLRLAKIITKLKGKKNVSKLLNSMTFSKNIEKTLSYDNANINNYQKDQYCGDYFTNQAIVDLVTMTKEVIDVNNIRKMLNTNYYIISGKDDPFSDKTKQLEKYINILDISNFQYQYKFYDNAKHEILNEKLKDEVHDDILTFINIIIKK